MATLTRKRKYEEVRWSLSRFRLAVCCAGVSALFVLPLCLALHCSLPRAHMSTSVAWPYVACQHGHV